LDQANRQGQVYRELSQNVRYAIEADRLDFQAKQRQFLQEIMAKGDALRDLRKSLEARQGEKGEWQGEVARRKATVAELNQEIAKAKKAADTALQGQTRKENELFEAHRKSAVDQEQNRALENQIRQLELAR